jgi:hypothetical protein
MRIYWKTGRGRVTPLPERHEPRCKPTPRAHSKQTSRMEICRYEAAATGTPIELEETFG